MSTNIQTACAYESPKEFTIDLVNAFSRDTLPENPTNYEFFLASYDSAFRFAVDLFTNKTCDFPDLLPNTKLNVNSHVHFNSPARAVRTIIEIAENGSSLAIGFPNSETSVSAADAGLVYDISIFSSFSPVLSLSSDKYPFFTKITTPIKEQVAFLQETLISFFERSGPGWTDVAVISTIDDLSLDNANQFVLQAESRGINILQYQQYLSDQTNLELELQVIKDSGARVIFASLLGDIVSLLEAGDALGLIGEHYVWATAGHTMGVSLRPSPLARGLFAVFQYNPPDSKYSECHTDAYVNADPSFYIGAGTANPLITAAPFDNVLGTLLALDTLDKMEMLDRRVSAEMMTEAIRNTNYEGLTGNVSFAKNGDRIGDSMVVFYNDISNEIIISSINTQEEVIQVADIIWYSGSTDLPDLDIRPPFSYWSCKDGEERVDETGKTISIHTPDGSNIDEIDSHYHCDYFIDCYNLYDESQNCKSNYVIVYAIFGSITFLLMLICILLIVFVLLFGVFLNYQRVKVASPHFLIMLLISIFIGYSSIFAFFGKPHPVSCGFQPWLLGLPAISMIVLLCVKNFRVYRIFRFPLKKVKISNLEVFLLWLIVMIPAFFIVLLWTIISTPTAAMRERDGEDHYVCTTGGFTGEPGGYVFFSILVAYGAFVLLIGAVISVLARNIPSLFNESKLLTISIYNLGFLSAVIIPVFLVINPFNPFIAWILRTVAVLYAFTATMVVQFLPLVTGVVVIDRFKNIQRSAYYSSSGPDRPGSN